MTARLTTLQLVAGAASSATSVLAAAAAMPLYLRFLGVEAFGVLGFVTTLQAAVLALDAGLGVSITRRMAQARNAQARHEVAALVRGLSRAAWLLALAIALGLAAASPLITRHWLNLDSLPATEATWSLVMAAVAIALRWPIALYQGVLIGGQRIAAMAVLNIGITVLTTTAAVAAAAWSAGLQWVMGCLLVGALLHVLGCRHIALRAVGAAEPGPRGMLLGFMRQASEAGWLGVIGLLLMQQDKLILSWILPVGEFGYYVLASLIATSLYALITPVFNIVYPRLAQAAGEDRGAFEASYRRTSLMFATFLFPLAAALGIFGESILQLWTGDPAAALAGGRVVLLLAFGTALHGAMFMPYALKMAFGESRLALRIGLALLLLSLPATWLGAWRWGGQGAAAGWLCLHGIYLVIGSMLTHARLLPTLRWRWLFRDVGPPLLASVVIVALAGMVSAGPHSGASGRVAAALLSVVACWALLVVTSPRLRQAIHILFAKPA